MTAASLATGVLAALAIGLGLQPWVLRVMTAAAVIDTPCARSSHATPTPRGGGLAVATAAAAGLLLGRAPLPIVLALLLFATIGLLEDMRGVPVGTRLGLQIGAGAVTGLLLVPAPLAGPVAVATGLAVGFWLTGYANAFNFMDGVNGISAAHAALAGLVYTVVGLGYGLPELVVAGAVTTAAAVAFLPFNAGRARIFLGDVGSYGLGGLLGAAAAYGVLHGAPVEAMLAPLALYLADTGWTLAGRCWRGEPWYRPHRGHAYQRLTDLGWSHQRVTTVTVAASAAVCAAGLAAAGSGLPARIGLVALAALLLAGYLAGPSWLAARPARLAGLAGADRGFHA
jgi:UDP-N-acetylmuramyl pentapeptide phosphotransferase/UDP-N-acetylglucosamine-1-phosphate transferase